MNIIYEMCPYCNYEVELKEEFKKQVCPECGKLIKPCCMCNMNTVKCNECPLGED